MLIKRNNDDVNGNDNDNDKKTFCPCFYLASSASGNSAAEGRLGTNENNANASSGCGLRAAGCAVVFP